MMKGFNDTDIESIINQTDHHAYIVFKKIEEPVRLNSQEEVHVIQNQKVLNVADVRWLSEYLPQDSGESTKKIVVIAAGITKQAQSALLKTLEEIHGGIYLFICLPPGTEILSTLLSRCYVVDDSKFSSSEYSAHFKKFINAKEKDRLIMINTMWEEGDVSRHSVIIQFLQDLELYTEKSIRNSSSGTHASVLRCKRVANNLRDAIYWGALHKGTLQSVAFI